MKHEYDELVEHPTYSNLLSLFSKLKEEEQDTLTIQRMEEEVELVENLVLKGVSLRHALDTLQMLYQGSRPDVGLASYISTVWDLSDAYTFDDGVVLQIEIPLSHIRDFGAPDSERPEHNSEVNLVGPLDPIYITAIIPGKSINGIEHKKRLEEIPYFEMRKQQFDLQEKLDEVQFPNDMREVRMHRATKICEAFPQLGLNIDEIMRNNNESTFDPLSHTKSIILNYFISIGIDSSKIIDKVTDEMTLDDFVKLQRISQNIQTQKALYLANKRH